MFKENFESAHITHETSETIQAAPEDENNYSSYQKLGGVINEKDYLSTQLRAKFETTPSASTVAQVEVMARVAGIELHTQSGAADERIILYGILRADNKPADVEHHHAQMGDQQLFAEALKMVGDSDSLAKLIASHPAIFSH